MRTTAAVLMSRDATPPFAESLPLTVTEVELDDPGPTEVLVRIESAGLCHSDLSVVNGDRPRPTPMVLGHEASGRVVAVGSAVTDLAAGQRVVTVFVPSCGTCERCAAGRPALCTRGAASNTAGVMPAGGTRIHLLDGRPVNHHLGVSAFAAAAVVDRRSLIRVDEDIPAETAALFGCAVMTGAGAVLNTAGVGVGDPVAIFGLGGVGLSAVMAAALVHASPIIVVDPVPEKRSLALELGATHALPPEGASAAIVELTGGGVRFAIEAVGHAEVLRSAWDATGPGGSTISVGIANPSHEVRIPAAQLVAQGRRLIGSYVGDCVPERDIPRLIGMWRSGLLPVDRLRSAITPLSDINVALDRLASGGAVRQMLQP
jgi:alcohol dehydrogenase